MKIKIRKSAINDLKKIDHQYKENIHLKISELRDFPVVTNVKKLTKFEPAYRMKFGNYRILFDVVDDTIEIGRILHKR